MGVLISKCEDNEKARLAKPPTCDIYRDSPLRILGYAGHLGICSNLLSPKAILTGQMVSTAYILGDVFQKSAYSARKFESEKVVIRNSIDAFLWQLLASVILPGFILTRTRSLTRAILRKASKNNCGPSSQQMNWIPCIAGLIVAPFIMKPIDNCVDYIMENTYRDWAKESDKPNAKISGQDV